MTNEEQKKLTSEDYKRQSIEGDGTQPETDEEENEAAHDHACEREEAK